ncbi:MAG: tetratricopeptide repeat protein, partial [Rhodospirillaceae bacterium]|nr:tetratricopeptide repeat protein [Rhodospirillaceae bacterium]
MTELQTTIRTARELIGAGRPAEAAQMIADALDAEPGNSEALYALAVAQRHQHKWADALASLEQVLGQRPGYGRAHQEVGYNRLARQDYAGARDAFERAVAADPDSIKGHYQF